MTCYIFWEDVSVSVREVSILPLK